MDRERQAREDEIKRQGRNLLFSGMIGLVVMIGTFYDMLGPLKAYVPEFLAYKWVIGLLTTPIVFGPGRQFFTNSWRGLKHGVTDMNLLYATGIGAAYGIAVINTIFPGAGFGGEGAQHWWQDDHPEQSLPYPGLLQLHHHSQDVRRRSSPEHPPANI